MKQISSMDLYFLTKELQLLENQRIDSIYLEDNSFYMKMYIKNQGNKFLNFNIGKYIYLGGDKNGNSVPSSFITYLRKNLKNGFIRKFEQIENERILKIEIEKKVEENKFEKYNLYLELFAPGNIILTDDKNIIKNMLSRKKFKDRKIIAKEEYELPPKKELSIFNLDDKLFENQLKESDLEIVKFLAIKFGLGGKFSEEIIFRSKIDKNKKCENISKDEIKKITLELDLIKKNEINSFSILNSNKEIIDFIPIEFESIKNEKLSGNSFNDILLNYFSNLKESIGKDSIERELQLQLKKLKNRLKKQEQQRDRILIESSKFNEIGNKIYENYSNIEELLNSINESSKKIGWEKTLDKIKQSTNSKLKKIKKIDYKNNSIYLEL